MKVKRLTEDTFFARGLGWLTRAIVYHRRWFLYPQLLLCAACIVYTFRCLELDTSRDHLVGPNQEYHQNFQKVKQEFRAQDDLVVVVESEDSTKNRHFVDRLAARLEAETNLFHNIFYKGDLKVLGNKALLFVPEPQLAELKKTLVEYRPFLQQFTGTTNLVSLFGMINKGFRTAKRERNPETEAMLSAFPAVERIVNEALWALKRPGTPRSPGISALFSKPGSGENDNTNAADEAEQQTYVTFAQGRLYLVTAQAVKVEQNAQAIDRIRALIKETLLEVPGVNIGLTGEVVLEHDEMKQSQTDTELASVVALVVCALIFIYGYQETGRPIKATLCLIVGVAYTLAFATWTVGHLNVLTITFVPILIGLAIDYGVHLISRYEEELRRGRTEPEAMHKAIVYTGQGIFTGAFTTAGAFWAMTFTNFRGIQEMGIICGGGLLICLVPMITLLPALLLKGRQNAIDYSGSAPVERRARIENIWLERPVLVTALTVILCALAFTQVPKVKFDYNLLHMQSAGLPAVDFEKKLLDSANKSLLFGAVLATNEQNAAVLLEKLTNLPSVADVESITKRLTVDQHRQLQLVKQIKSELTTIAFRPPDPRPVDLSELSSTLYSLYGYLGAACSDVETRDPPLAQKMASLRRAVNAFHREMLCGGEATLQTNALKLAAFQQALFDDVRQTFEALKNQDCGGPLRVEDLPRAIRERFVGITGKFLLMVYPKKDLRERSNQKEFIEQVQSVYPSLSGTPTQLYYYTELLKRSYEEAARYSLVAIVLLVMFHFRSPLCVALSLIPVAIGFLWLGGLMGWLGVPLNPANIMILPLVIGIGVTNGIHILNRYAEEQTPSILARSTGKAVLVSGLTSIAGFGSLVLAKHQGIKSLGYVMSCGLATCMIAGLTFLPALLKLLSRQARPRPQRTVDQP